MPFGPTERKETTTHTRTHTHTHSVVSAIGRNMGKAASRGPAQPLKCVKSLITPTPVQGEDEGERDERSVKEQGSGSKE